MTAIASENLGRTFGGNVAVEALTLDVGEGEIFGLLGPNGAGKTTTLRLLTGLLRPTTGRAWVLGRDVTHPKEALEARRLVGVVPETPGLYEGLSVEQNLDFHGRLHGLPPNLRRKRVRDLLRWLDLGHVPRKRVASLSRGMRQKVALARALLHDPKVLFLDEPTAGLDPGASRGVQDALRGLRDEGRTIFLSTHDLQEASRLCDRIGVLNRRLLSQGTPGELARGSGGTYSVLRLRKLSPGVVEGLQGLPGVRRVTVTDSVVQVETSDPRRFNPVLIETIVKAGGEIESVSGPRPELEEIYQRLLGGNS